MPGFSNFRFDTLSFWLGFLTATLLWWLVQKIRPAVPRLAQRMRHQVEQMRRKSGDRLDDTLRREVLRRAQGLHLASPLFPLDEILVEPLLLAPPPAWVNPGQITPNTIANQVVPYLPDWPEVSASYPVERLRAAEALQNGARIAVIGQPGSGKTVLLAHLASQIASHVTLPGNLHEKTPTLVHALDLVLEGVDWKTDPLLPLIKAVSAQTSVLVQSQIPRFLRAVAADDRLLILVDGLDEIHPQNLPNYTAWLAALGSAYPNAALMVAASPAHLDGLGSAGFLPLAVAGWSAASKELFLENWSTAWGRFAEQPLATQTGVPPVDRRMLRSWLTSQTGYFSPLEWTLQAWALFAGDVRGSSPIDALEAYLRRATRGQVSTEVASQLGAVLIARGQPALTYRDMEQAIASLQPVPETAPATAADAKSRSKTKTPALSQSGQVISSLRDAGVLSAHPGDLLRFTHPVVGAYLAGQCITAEDAPLLATTPHWTLALETARFAATGPAGQAVTQAMLASDGAPLYSGLLAVSRWLKDAPANSIWRAGVLRRLFTLIQQEELIFGLRARFLGAFIAANDESVTLLLKQMMASKSLAARQLAALGCGAVQNNKLVTDLMGLLGDTAPDVRFTACLALAAYALPATQEALSAALTQGDEGLQQAAAEVLADQPGHGHELLKTALTSDSLLVRRAAVLGMTHIREDWAAKLLEKTAVEDAQWVVRSAAAQAVENRQQGNPYLPAALPKAADAPWLITYASKQGTGVPANSFPLDLLISAMQNGTQDEKLAALAYTRDLADERVLGAVHELLGSSDPTLREAAFYTLWSKAASGQTVERLGVFSYLSH